MTRDVPNEGPHCGVVANSSSPNHTSNGSSSERPLKPRLLYPAGAAPASPSFSFSFLATCVEPCASRPSTCILPAPLLSPTDRPKTSSLPGLGQMPRDSQC